MLTVPPDLTWNILQTSKSSKVEHSFLNCRGHITAHSGNSKFQCNLVVAGHGLLLFSCCQDLMQTQLQKFSRPHIVNLWNWEGNKYKANRADLFHCVKVCLWPVLHSLTVPGLERLNGWTPMISTLSIPLPSSRSGIRMWYIGFCWRYKFVFTNNSWHYQRPSTLGSLLLCVWIEP